MPGSNSNTAGVVLNQTFIWMLFYPVGVRSVREAWRQCVETTKYTGAGSEQW